MERQANRGKCFLGETVHMLHYFLAGKQERVFYFIYFLVLSSCMPDMGKEEIKCIFLSLFCSFFQLLPVVSPSFF